MSGPDIKASIAELLSSGVLVSEDFMALPYLHRKLRGLLDSHGANMTQHSSRRIIMTPATNLYDEAEDREAAENMAKHRISKMRSGADSSTSTQAQAPLQESSSSVPTREHETNTAHKVSMGFKEDKKKFSGAIGEYLNDYVSDYLQAARDHDLTPAEKIQFLHNILTGNVKGFYYNRVEGYASGFSRAIMILEDEYNYIYAKIKTVVLTPKQRFTNMYG